MLFKIRQVQNFIKALKFSEALGFWIFRFFVFPTCSHSWGSAFTTPPWKWLSLLFFPGKVKLMTVWRQCVSRLRDLINCLQKETYFVQVLCSSFEYKYILPHACGATQTFIYADVINLPLP